MSGHKFGTSRARIVMIEAEPSYTDAFTTALAVTLDLYVAAGATGVDAGIDLCHELNPDLVVCDYELGHGDSSTDLVARLRSSGVTTPIVFLIGRGITRVRHEPDRDVYVISKDDRMAAIISDLRALAK